MANFKAKTTAAASRGFLAAARLSRLVWFRRGIHSKILDSRWAWYRSHSWQALHSIRDGLASWVRFFEVSRMSTGAAKHKIWCGLRFP